MGNKQKVNDLIKRAQEEKRNLLEHEILTLLDLYDLPLPPFKFIPYNTKVTEAVLDGFTYPLVLKVVSRDIVHKSDYGGVKLNLWTKESVLEAIKNMDNTIKNKLSDVKIDGWLLRSFIPEGTELIAGSITDPQLGIAVMAGIGGIFTEAYKDVSFRLAPVSPVDAMEMLDELKGQAILNGLRSATAVSRNIFANIFTKYSQFISENSEIIESDLNPIICNGEQIMIADARVKVKEK